MTEPRCPYFNQCGGCTAQHIAYPLQLENKQSQLKKLINTDNIQIISDSDYNYRNRMDFIFHANGIGLRKRGDWKAIVDIKECSISEPTLNQVLTELRNHFKNPDYFDLKKQSGTYKYAVIRTGTSGVSVSFVLNKNSSRIGQAIDQIKEFAQKTSASHIVVTYVDAKTDMSIGDDFFVIKGNDMLEQEYLGKKFLYSVQGFFQNNHAMAIKLQEYVNALLKKHNTQSAHLLDLYGGVGTFGIINADLFKSVTIVESVQQCIDAANKNIQINNINNAKALVLDATQLKKLDLPQPLMVITDPPRSGMHTKTIEQLNKLNPVVIIYISCNPQQMAKELPKFKNYEIKSAATFDLFPQTPHAEAVVELVKKSSEP